MHKFWSHNYRLERRIRALEERIAEMATQDDINAVVAQLQDDEAGIAAVDQRLTDAAGKFQTELDNLQAQINAGQPVDLSRLQALPGEIRAATDALGSHVDAVSALTPTPAPGS